MTHGPGVLILGYTAQGVGVLSAQPWTLALVVALSILPAILLAGIPDRTADRNAGKLTLVVRLGAARSVQLAIAFLVLSALGTFVLALGPVPIGPALGIIAVPHAAGLTWLLLRYHRAGAPERRIDPAAGAGAAIYRLVRRRPLRRVAVNPPGPRRSCVPFAGWRTLGRRPRLPGDAAPYATRLHCGPAKARCATRGGRHGDLGGAVALATTVVGLPRCVTAHDRDLARRLLRELRCTELRQRAVLARMIGRR